MEDEAAEALAAAAVLVPLATAEDTVVAAVWAADSVSAVVVGASVEVAKTEEDSTDSVVET